MHFYPKIICCCAKGRLIKIMSFIYNQQKRTVRTAEMAWSRREKADVVPSSVAGPPVCARRGKKSTVSFGSHFLAQKFTDKSWRRGWEFKKRDRSPLCWQTLRLWEECIGGVGSPRRIRYGFINEQQAAVAVAIAYLVVSIWKEWEQERERARRRGIERKNREHRWQTQGKGDVKQVCAWKGGVARSRVSSRLE